VGFISRPELARGGTDATASNINCDILHKPTAPVHAIGAISIPPLSPACTSVHGGHHHYYRQPKQELPKGAEEYQTIQEQEQGTTLRSRRSGIPDDIGAMMPRTRMAVLVLFVI
jgi:hypothetical protein